MHKSKVNKIIHNFKNHRDTLSNRVVISGFWVFALRIVNRGFSLIRLIILARILAPHDFGLMGIALLTLATLETFSQTGFQAALIQKKEDIKSHLDAAWTVLILRGFILFAILYLIAPYAAIFFNVPEAKSIIQVIGLSLLLQGFTNIGVIYFHKELEFNKEFIYQFAGTLADFIVAVSAVLILRNVWALVLGSLAGNAAGFIVSYLIHPYRPHLSSDFGKAKELFGFGKWILGANILIFLITQGDDIFVGKLLGATALGFYQLAYRISNMPSSETSRVISKVTFPAYSKLQNDLPKLREAYLKVLQVTAFLSFLIAGLILVLAPDFTRIFLGEKWMPMVPAMMALCIFGVTRSIGATMGPILYSVGRPKIQTKLSSIQLIAMAVIIYPLTIQWGILGTSLAVVIPNILVLILITREAKNIIEFSYKDFFMSIIAPLIAVFIMFFAIFLKQSLLPSGSNILNFFMLAVLGSIIYFGIIYLWDKSTGYKMQHEIHEIFSNLGGR
jgi:lipopolysaccharide exporter